jgi:hypothetical protein
MNYTEGSTEQQICKGASQNPKIINFTIRERFCLNETLLSRINTPWNDMYQFVTYHCHLQNGM